MVKRPELAVGHSLMKMVGLIYKIGDTMPGKDKANISRHLQESINSGFTDYLSTCLNAKVCQINFQIQRQDQLNNLIGMQKLLQE